MGYHLVGEVLGHAPDLPYRQFRILVALALDATDSTRLAKPGHELLALHGNCSIRTAGRAVGKLETRGYVKTETRPGPNRRAVYMVLPMPGAPGGPASQHRPIPLADERTPIPLADEHRPPGGLNVGHLATNVGHLSAQRRPIPLAPPEPIPEPIDLNPPSHMTEPSTGPLPSADRRAAQPPGPAADPADDDFDFDPGTEPASLNGQRAGTVPAAPGPASPAPDQFVFGSAPPRRAPKLAVAWDDPHGPGYGQCPRCERWVSVNLGGGRILPHDGPADGQQCPGSHYRPAYPVPCAGCGNSTVALRTDGKCSTCRRHRHAGRAAP